MKTVADYTTMQRTFYEAETGRMSEQNHRHHDQNPDYWTILLRPLYSGDWTNKIALDFGCGCGRNVMNILDRFIIKEAHGCDISASNIKYCENLLETSGYKNFKFFPTNGTDLGAAEDNSYDFIMSTIVLQHICVHSIRRSIFEHMFKALKPGGIVSIQMGYGEIHPNAVGYYEDAVWADGTNSANDVKVTDPNQVCNDFRGIGLVDVKYVLRPAFTDSHQYWIFVQGTKP